MSSLRAEGDSNVMAGRDLNVHVRMMMGGCVCQRSKNGCPFEKERSILYIVIIVMCLVHMLDLKPIKALVSWWLE